MVGWQKQLRDSARVRAEHEQYFRDPSPAPEDTSQEIVTQAHVQTGQVCPDPNCQKQNAAESRFCNMCGKPLLGPMKDSEGEAPRKNDRSDRRVFDSSSSCYSPTLNLNAFLKQTLSVSPDSTGQGSGEKA